MQQKILSSLLTLLLTSQVLLKVKLAAQQKEKVLNKKEALNKSGKAISPDLFGVFFEDLSYSADGGLYAELVQNRSFEYNPADKKGWNPLSAWEYCIEGHAYGSISVENSHPINANNPHYVVLNVEDSGTNGLSITNYGYEGILMKQGEKYNFSVYIKQLSNKSIPILVELRNKKGILFGSTSFFTTSNEWQQYSATITAVGDADSVGLSVLAKSTGKLAIDEISLFPESTFKNEKNGLRQDLAQAIADLKPKFMRFPGGCLVHGDGLGNMYRWKNTIGPVEQRLEQRNIWHYHQSVGLGFYEYFRFCEDIGAKPLPIVAAGVSCQNSGMSKGTGQKAIAVGDMQDYIQDVLDLIEYANGAANSKWGAKRAAAGHPEPFNLQYIGIGNEDKQTDDFRDRFKLIYDAVRKKYPEIIIVGTAGPFPDGEDYTLGWKFAEQLAVPIIDEHVYAKAEWFLGNNKRFDHYRRESTEVYLGEFASQGNTLLNALSEAAFMTSMERNGDVVKMASYAPLLANVNHISWSPNLIFFNNKQVAPTVNYYVQQLFSANQGDHYFHNVITFKGRLKGLDSTLASSCVKDNRTGDVILKIVNAGPTSVVAETDLSRFSHLDKQAAVSFLSGNPNDKNTMAEPKIIVPVLSETSTINLRSFNIPAYSLTVVRINSKL